MKNQSKTKQEQRRRRHARVRARAAGAGERPRLAVFRSNRFVSAQVIDDAKGATLVSAHGREFKSAGGGQSAQAAAVGGAIAERAKAAGVTQVVFDRGGYQYGGQVKALADAARKGGLIF